MLDPRLLLLDEPTAGLSPMLVGGMLEKIVEIHRTGVAMLIVEQNARQALRAHRGYVLAMGQNRYEDTGRRCSRTQKSAPCSWVALIQKQGIFLARRSYPLSLWEES